MGVCNAGTMYVHSKCGSYGRACIWQDGRALLWLHRIIIIDDDNYNK